METDLEPEDPQLFLKEAQRQDFTHFFDAAWPLISGGELVERNWHIDAIAFQLEQVRLGRSRRLMINLPPRYAKSKIVSIIWVAWMLGQDPSLNFVGVSYSNELSYKLARDCLLIMQSAWYKELFPGTKLKREVAHDIETTAGGGRLATSVTGSLTGRGGDIIIMDDVIKPGDAMSEVVRESVNEWFRTTLSSRLNSKESGAIICVMQRLHQYDLCGMLLEAGGWDQLAIPAIAIEDETIPLPRGEVHLRKAGDLLHPERESLAALNYQQSEMGSVGFTAQYQQSPVPALGNIFRAPWLRTYDEVDPSGGGEIVQSWDTGIKTADGNSFSVGITAFVRQRFVYVLDVWRGRLEFPDLLKKLIELARLHGAHTLLIEDRASGQQLIQTLRSENPPGVPQPIACTPDNDKRTRAEGVSSLVEAGQLLLPREAPWLGDFKAELLAFPSSRYDDQVDALSQLLVRVRNHGTDQNLPIPGPMLYTEDMGWSGEGSESLNDNFNFDYDDVGDGWI